MFSKKLIYNSLILMVILCNEHAFAQINPDSYIKIDVEGAMHTSPVSINEGKMVTGRFVSKDGGQAFIRMPSGDITTFKVKDARITYALSINDAGTITGFSSKLGRWESPDAQGFVRELDGKIKVFEAPNAKGGTKAVSINKGGDITGYARKSPDSFETQGFLRQANGTMTMFDAPGAAFTKPFSINKEGVITGCYDTVASQYSCQEYRDEGTGRGFMRMADGTFITFDVSGAKMTVPISINNNGDIAGFYNFGRYGTHSFLRTKEGVITPFHVQYQGNLGISEAYVINNKRAIAGSSTKSHVSGYIREANGNINSFDLKDVPHTSPRGMNDAGDIVGNYRDESEMVHGFLLLNSKSN